MDGHFVPNITMGAPVLASVHKTVDNVFMDCHMMVADPKRVRFRRTSLLKSALLTTRYATVGQARRRSRRQVVHLPHRSAVRPWFVLPTLLLDCLASHGFREHTENAHEVVDLIHSTGMRAAVAISPDTPSSAISDRLGNSVDMLLVMTVVPGALSLRSHSSSARELTRSLPNLLPHSPALHPSGLAHALPPGRALSRARPLSPPPLHDPCTGAGGQKFMQRCVPKVAELRARFPQKDIQVDGGVGPGTVGCCARAGASRARTRIRRWWGHGGVNDWMTDASLSSASPTFPFRASSCPNSLSTLAFCVRL